jgi:hypothetical protein
MENKMTASFVMDEDYFKEALNEWISSISKGRKFEPYLCSLFFVLGVTILVFFPKFQLVGYLGIFIGVFEGYKYLRFKKHWLKECLNSKLHNQVVVIKFENGVVEQLKPKPQQSLSEPVFSKIVISKRGCFLFPFEGRHIYIPQSSISPQLTMREFIEILRANQAFQLAAKGGGN